MAKKSKIAANERRKAVVARYAERRAELTWEHKGPADFVSAVDRGAEDLIRDALLAAHPDAVFIGEETYDPAVGLGDALAFVVDPLDGTINYLYGLSAWCVSVACEGLAGVVYDPLADELFASPASPGAPATWTGRRSTTWCCSTTAAPTCSAPSSATCCAASAAPPA